ncbi:DnaA regulatory inactivator Hda [Aestuariibacter sp. AA17]|uniref:DnaA regulatory inactivator Hda n=1 Tax=Fluctibacter corallii TaxID=2984329 RepID=A0ABT3A5T4_9ALTE|nr:DnaA regulatory inactivator Hda [Aestuariibacter sp. AA17]MCV2884040.1 DnaA regulatory inactivator Hda [Aestuariibacter sp. AA17]
MAKQLSLPVQLPDDETFSSFMTGQNIQLVTYLNELLEPDSDQPFLTFISGDQGAGKSHLLYSVCHRAEKRHYSHFYLNLSQRSEWSTSILNDLENVKVICIDDVHAIAHDPAWQLALFDLINRVREAQHSLLIMTANAGPKQLGVELPDLASRLSWGVAYHVQPLSEDERLLTLISRAERRGIALSMDVARFMMTHMQRDMASLMKALEKLDNISLQQKRRLTIPFIKDVLSL